METFSLGFAAGASSLLFWQRSLPSALFFLVAALVLLFLIKLLRNREHKFATFLFYLTAALLGIAWADYSATLQLRKNLPPNLQKQIAIVQGTLVSIPERLTYGQRFEFLVKNSQPPTVVLAGRKLRLTWNKFSALHVGDQWQLHVRLQSPHSTLNPSGFDEDAWLLQHHINAIGNVIPGQENYLLHKNNTEGIDTLREHLALQISHYTDNSINYTGFIEALTVGIRDQITEAEWQVLRNTGTNHLMAIAGLHIGFVSMAAYFLAGRFFRLFPRLLLLCPAPQLSAFLALFAAICYSALAGFSLPTVRAIIMLTVFLGSVLMRRYLPPWRAWSIALLVVLITDPLAPLSSSFWLSFITVALIIYGLSGRLQFKKNYWHWIHIQWIITIGLVPLMLLFFHQVSIGGLIANTVAIPWVGIAILPLCLCGAICSILFPPLGGALIKLAVYAFVPLWWFLEKIAAISWLQWHGNIANSWILFSVFLGVLLILAPRGLPGRWVGIMLFLPLLFYNNKNLPDGALELTILDVKKGLIAIISTRHHNLIYTTQTQSATEKFLTPVLQNKPQKQVDFIISQQDVTSPNAWQWDSIGFKIIDNALLIITPDKTQVVLTPNLYLLKNIPLANTQIIVTIFKNKLNNSSIALLQQLKPSLLLFSNGWQSNANSNVSTVCNSLKISCYKTASSGALQLDFKNANFLQIKEFRKENGKFWNRW